MARFHFGAMEDSGHNARITDAIRSSGAVPVITAAHIDPILRGMKAHGIDFGSDAEGFVKYILPSASAAVAPTLTTSLNNGHTVIKLQRSVHAELVKLSAGGHSQAVSNPRHSNLPHLSRAAYVPPKLMRVSEDDPLDCWCEDEGGAWYDSGWSGAEVDSGDYWDPTYTDYLSSGWLNSVPTTYTTPSGAVINLCTVFWAVTSMSAGSWSALLAAGGGDAAFGVGFVAANPELAVAILAIGAAIAAYLAIVC